MKKIIFCGKVTDVDYKVVLKFKTLTGNRSINPNQVKKLQKELIVNGEWNQVDPVIIGKDTKYIYDGQHRVVVFLSALEDKLIPEDSKLLVQYVQVNPEDELKYVQELQVGTSWKNKDYVNSHIALGNPNYVALHNWCKKFPLFQNSNSKSYPLMYRHAASIIEGKRQCNLNQGKYIFSEEKAAKAELIVPELQTLISILGFDDKKKSCNLEAMGPAWIKFREKCPFNVWTKVIRMKKNHAVLTNYLGNIPQCVWEQYFNGIYHQIKDKQDAIFA